MITQFASPLIGNEGNSKFLSKQEIQAIATAMDGFTVVDDFEPVVREYLRKATIFWPLLRKESAYADLVREITEGPEPTTGFFDKHATNPTDNPTNLAAHDLTDPGEYIKAVGGVISFSPYSRSLYKQQGRPYGNTVAKKTADLIVSATKTLERTLFLGNATTNPLEFNGLEQQIDPSHVYTADITAGDSVVRKIRSLARLIVSDPDILRNVTHIFTTGLGLELIEEEVTTQLEYTNLDEVRPGLRVPAIITQADPQGRPTPIITSPYILDTAGVSGTVPFWLLDMDTLVWKGVIPDGGLTTFNPQIFEVSQYTYGATPNYLVNKRMCLAYGTLYASKAGGGGVYRLDVNVPLDRVTGI
jgi:hypothetical protein